MLSLEPNEMFIGFNSDTTASLVLNFAKNQADRNDILLKAKKCLLQCATPDSVVRAVSGKSSKLAKPEREFIWDEYFVSQKHLALDQLVKYHMCQNNSNQSHDQLVQVTTHSKSTLLSLDMDDFKKKIEIDCIDVCLLNAFDTQIQFVDRLRQYLNTPRKSLERKSLMLVQIELTERYDNDLLSCVRHLTVDTFKEFKAAKRKVDNAYVFIVVIVPRENVRNVSGFQLGTIIVFFNLWVQMAFLKLIFRYLH